MPDNNRFQNLLQPFQIRQTKLKNRIVCAAHSRYYGAEDCHVSDVDLATYEALAAGGVGLIVLEWCSVDHPLGSRLRHHTIADDKHALGLSKLVDVIHRHDCPVYIQLGHAGPAQVRKEFNVQPVSSSALNDSEKPIPGYDTAREMTVAEIEDLVAKFTRSAERARKAGFDGIEVHAAHAYLLNTFLSGAWNKRTDAYGCQDVASRTRLSCQIIQEIKKSLGQDYPVGIRINGQEWGHEKGITIDESRESARVFEKAGADYISVSGWGYGAYKWILFPEQIMYPEPEKEMAPLLKQINKPGIFVPAAEIIKKSVSVPVMAAGKLEPELGEWILQNKKADLIGIVRSLIADPELPNKIAAGKYDEIAPCTRCVECGGRVTETKPIVCRVNASLGKELQYVSKPAARKKRVVVVGGGPGGMEAARVAALRGHEVTLYDKNRELGGLLSLASFIKGEEIEDIPALLRYFKIQMQKLGVKTNLGKEVTPGLIEEVKPDVVIIATGGTPAKPEITGIDRPNVLGSSDLQRRAKMFLRLFGPGMLGRLTKVWMPVGHKVIIIGGLIQGCQLAEFLVKRGREVTILEAGDQLGTGIPEIHRPRLITWLQNQGAIMLTGVKYEEITANGVTVVTKDGGKQTIEANTILTAVPMKPNKELFQALQGKVPEVYLVGDCAEPRKLIDAIDDGRRIGLSV